MSIVFPVDAQAIPRFAVSMTNRALVEPAKVVHLKMLLHVAHVYSHFAAQKALNALSASSVLLCVCRDKFVEFKLLLRIVGWAEKNFRILETHTLLKFGQVVNFPHVEVQVGCC